MFMTKPRRTRFAPVTAAIGLALLAGGALRADDLHAFKQLTVAIETSSDLVDLPPAGGSVVTARTCEACVSQVLRISDETIYMINDVPVGYDDFTAAARAKPNLIYVHFRRSDDTILRLRLDQPN